MALTEATQHTTPAAGRCNTRVERSLGWFGTPLWLAGGCVGILCVHADLDDAVAPTRLECDRRLLTSGAVENFADPDRASGVKTGGARLHRPVQCRVPDVLAGLTGPATNGGGGAASVRHRDRRLLALTAGEVSHRYSARRRAGRRCAPARRNGACQLQHDRRRLRHGHLIGSRWCDRRRGDRRGGAATGDRDRCSRCRNARYQSLRVARHLTSIGTSSARRQHCITPHYRGIAPAGCCWSRSATLRQHCRAPGWRGRRCLRHESVADSAMDVGRLARLVLAKAVGNPFEIPPRQVPVLLARVVGNEARPRIASPRAQELRHDRVSAGAAPQSRSSALAALLALSATAW